MVCSIFSKVLVLSSSFADFLTLICLIIFHHGFIRFFQNGFEWYLSSIFLNKHFQVFEKFFHDFSGLFLIFQTYLSKLFPRTQVIFNFCSVHYLNSILQFTYCHITYWQNTNKKRLNWYNISLCEISSK